MKKLFVLGTIILSVHSYSQVGFGTDNPKAMLDVNYSDDNSKLDGIISPQLTLQQLAAKGNTLYGSDQKGTLIYITDLQQGDATGQRVNINSTGYYYFDGDAWQKILNQSESINLYNSDGRLTENRTVGLDNNTLSFTGSAVNSFSIDGNTFSVDATNDRIGLGTSAPVSKLDVRGSINAANDIKAGDVNDINGSVVLRPGNPFIPGYVVIRQGGGNEVASIGAGPNSSMVYRTNDNRPHIFQGGNFGINTNSPSANLHTNGSVRLEGLNTHTSHNKVITSNNDGNIASRELATILPKLTAGYISPTGNVTCTSDEHNVNNCEFGTFSIYVERRSLVSLYLNVTSLGVFTNNGETPTDTFARYYGINLYGETNNFLDTASNLITTPYLTGFTTLKLVHHNILDAGFHNFKVDMFIGGGSVAGAQTTFAGNSNYYVVSQPVQ